jgi:hypothetical protein
MIFFAQITPLGAFIKQHLPKRNCISRLFWLFLAVVYFGIWGKTAFPG